MSEYSQLLKKAIDRNEFNDFFLGINGYQNNDRYNPSPIDYKRNLLGLYDLVNEEQNMQLISNLEELMLSICNNPEGIYISVNYIYTIIYHVKNGKCNIPIDITRFLKILSDAVKVNLELLKNTNEIKRVSLNSNLYERIVDLSQSCYMDNGIKLFEIEKSAVKTAQ